MCEKDFDENDSFIGRQEYFAPDYEKSQGDQDRQTEKISLVGELTRTETGTRGLQIHKPQAAHVPRSFMEWLAEETPTIGLPTRSQASQMAFRVASSVAYRKQLRAQRAQH